jgi:alkylresorcinol/alkylpyrone synthase
MISTGLFGDGAAAAVVAGHDTDFPDQKFWRRNRFFYLESEDVMGWDISETGFHIVLSPDVPKVIRENLGGDVDAFLALFARMLAVHVGEMRLKDFGVGGLLNMGWQLLRA